MESVGLIMQFLFSAAGAVFGALMGNTLIGAIVLFPVIAFIFLTIIDALRGSGNSRD